MVLFDEVLGASLESGDMRVLIKYMDVVIRRDLHLANVHCSGYVWIKDLFIYDDVADVLYIISSGIGNYKKCYNGYLLF